jgi:hypothetical protein
MICSICLRFALTVSRGDAYACKRFCERET